jgi:hypothetical protein
MIQITLPDEVAERARDAGLLSDGAVRVLLEDALRRRAGEALLAVAGAMHAAGVPPMTMDDIDAEVKAYRAERRAAKLAGAAAGRCDDAGRSLYQRCRLGADLGRHAVRAVPGCHRRPAFPVHLRRAAG